MPNTQQVVKETLYSTHSSQLVCQELQRQQPNIANLLIPLRSLDNKGAFWCFLACQVLQTRANNANGLFPMPFPLSKGEKGLFLDAFGLSKATKATAKQRKFLNSIEVQRQKRAFFIFSACQVLQIQANNANGLFPMPSSPSKDEKGFFLDAYGLSKATKAAANQRKSLNFVEVQRQKSGFFLFFRLTKWYKHRQTTQMAYFQCRPLRPKTKKGFFQTHMVCQKLQRQQPTNANLLISLRSRDKKVAFFIFSACQVLQTQANNANGLFPMLSSPSKDEKGLFLDAFGLSRATNAAAKQRISLNSIDVQRRKKAVFFSFWLARCYKRRQTTQMAYFQCRPLR